MKNTYKHSLAAVATAAVVFNFSSCGKYEDGPSFTLKSKTARLVGEWEVDEIDGESTGSDFTIEMEFEKDNDVTVTFEYSYYGYTYDYSNKGEWEWADNKEVVEVTFDGDDPLEFEVKRLTSDEFWFEYENEEWKLEKI